MSLFALSHRLCAAASMQRSTQRAAAAACRGLTTAAAAAVQPSSAAESITMAAAAAAASNSASAAAAASSIPPLRLGSASNRVSYSLPKARGGNAAAAAAASSKAAALLSYPLDTAVGLVRACAIASFDETVELALKLNLDPRKPNQAVRGAASLPNGTGVVVRVAVFAKGEKAQEALAAGADIVGEKDLADQILAGKINFDRCIATPDMMAFVGRVARILGPRGLMPNPKVGTVTADVGAAVKSAKQGSVEFKTDKSGCIHVRMGKASFSRKALAENIESFLEKMVEMKPSGAPKGTYIVSAHLSSTQGPGCAIDLKAAPFRMLNAGTGNSGGLTGSAALGAYGRMHSVNGFDVVRYDLGPHPTPALQASAKGKWSAVRDSIKRSRKDGDSWETALDKIEKINTSAPLPPKKPSTPVPSKLGKEAPAAAAAGAAKEPKAAKAPKAAAAAEPKKE